MRNSKIKNHLLRHFCSDEKRPFQKKLMNDHLVLMRLPVKDKKYLNAHASKMKYFPEEKNHHIKHFVTRSIPRSTKVLFLSEFNARVGNDSQSWQYVIRLYGIRDEHHPLTFYAGHYQRHLSFGHSKYWLSATRLCHGEASKYKKCTYHQKRGWLLNGPSSAKKQTVSCPKALTTGAGYEEISVCDETNYPKI